MTQNAAVSILKITQRCRLQEDDLINRNRLMQVETSKRAVEGELEATRRRLEQSEGGREAMLSQIGEINISHLFAVDDEHVLLMTQKISNYI